MRIHLSGNANNENWLLRLSRQLPDSSSAAISHGVAASSEGGPRSRPNAAVAIARSHLDKDDKLSSGLVALHQIVNPWHVGQAKHT
jgi:hypothetical protein